MSSSSSALSELNSSPSPPNQQQHQHQHQHQQQPKTKWWKQFTKSPLQSFDLLPQSNNRLISNRPLNSSNLLSNTNFINSSYNSINNSNSSSSSNESIFGISLEEALQRASVAISMLGPDQKAYIYGFIPVVVAKCGLYLKENGTTVEGIFRISGSTKRMKELQRLFDEPPLYGKDLDWRDPNPLEPNKQQPSSNSSPIDSNGKPYFSVHDASNVLRRYLMALPEPLIPTAMYQDFVQVLQRHADDTQKQIRLFKSLISTLNPPSQYLLLYLLDLLAVFANRSQLNLMTANNLALVFQPALCPTTNTLSRSEKFNRIINHHQNQQQQPNQHDINQTNPKDIQLESLQEQGLIMREAKQAQEVLEFLIVHQNFFVLGLRPQIKPAGPIPEISNDYDKDVARGECESEDEKRFKNVSTPKPSTTTTGSPMARRSLMNDPRLRSPSSCSIDEDELINNSQSSIKRSSILMRSKNGSLKDENLKMAANESVKRSKTLPSGHHHHLSKNSFRSNNDIFNQTVGTPVEALNQH